MTVSRERFRQVMGAFATGVTIVTTQDQEGRPYGLTVNAFTSVSLSPPLVLVCLDNELSGLDAFQESNHFGVNILAENQEDLSNHFARKGTDRADSCYIQGPTGVPLLEGVLATLECKVVSTYPAGDHTIFLGEVKSADLAEGQEGKGPLLYALGRYHRL